MTKHHRILLLKLLLLPCALLVSAFFFFNEKDTAEQDPRELLAKTLDSRLVVSKAVALALQDNRRPDEIHFDLLRDEKRLPSSATPETERASTNVKVKYTIDADMQRETDSILRRYKPDYAAVFMMDAENGKTLAMGSFQRGATDRGGRAPNWALKATFPAASVFKVITAAAAVDRAGISPEHKIAFNGGNYTLYKRNVMTDKVNRWTRTITLKEAFARSINTAFGRLSLESIHPQDLAEYAKRFMFNQDIPTDFPVEKGFAYVPEEKGYQLVQVASGFNRLNRMSPVQGAMIAATMVNHGKMLVPHMIESLENDKNEKIYVAQSLERGQIMEPESAEMLKKMMEQTVLTGTSRKAFRRILREKKFREVEMGGKTGHLNGDNPKGRTDWFVGYATDGEKKVAVAVVNVSRTRWTVKSSQVAEMLFRKYFNEVIEDRKYSAKSQEAGQNL